MRQSLYFTAIIFVFAVFSVASARADLVYNIVPYELENETTYTPEYVLGGTITMVDGADADGVLTLEEIIEARIQNTMSGEVWAYDDYDFTNINVQFVGNELIGEIRIQHTNTGEAFVDWGGGDLLSISNEFNSEFAQAPWSSNNAIAVRSVPEPASCLFLISAATLPLFRRKRII